MDRPLIYALAAAAVTLDMATAAALTIEVTPGTLDAASIMADSGDNILTVNGRCDIRDLIELARAADAFDTLDMSGLEITAYRSSRPLWRGHTVFVANTLPEYIFTGLRSSHVLLPSSLVAIGDGALASGSVSRIDIPSGVASVGAYAFYDCASLSHVGFPTSLVSVGEGALGGCVSLVSADLSATSVAELPSQMFSGCTALEDVSIPAAARKVGSQVFAGTRLTDLDLSRTDYIADFALVDMPYLRSVSLNRDAAYGRGVLMGCCSLTTISGVPADVPDLFAAHCSRLDPSSVTGIAEALGAWCLVSCGGGVLHLSETLVEISDGALSYMPGLTAIDATALGADMPSVSESAFHNISVEAVDLMVNDEDAGLWREHDVWGRFNVIGKKSSVGEGSAADKVSVAMSGHSLEIAAGDAIRRVVLYSPDGRCLGIHEMPSDTTGTSIDCSGLETDVIVVAVYVGDSMTTCKIMF